MIYPKPLQELIDSLKVLPGVGNKTSERYALKILELSDDEINDLIVSINDAHKKIRHCERCGNLSEEALCSICSDDNRDQAIICVVESITDVIAMEKTENYHGLYHVLNGLIAPAKGILVDDLNIESLKIRLLNDNLKEIVIATNLTIEGDTTSLYLSKMISVENSNILVSRIAHGLPVGGHLDYADDLTIIKAIEGRVKI